MDFKTIPHKIRATREQLNYTQEFVADKLDITQRAYSKIETGETRLRADHLVKLSEVLQLNITDLLADENTKYINIAEKQIGFQFIERQVVGNKQNIEALRGEIQELRSMVSDLLGNRKRD